MTDLFYRACPPSLAADPVEETLAVTFSEDGTFTGSFPYEESTSIEFVATPGA